MQNDGSQFWIEIGRGMNKYVTEFPEENEKLNHHEEVASRTVKSVAPKQKEQFTEFIIFIVPFDQRTWYDIPAVGYIAEESFNISKTMSRTLRHQGHHREKDEAMKWRRLLPKFCRDHPTPQNGRIDYPQRGSDKKRFLNCLDSGGFILCMLAIQGHSGSQSLLLSCASPASAALSTLHQSPRRHLATLPGLLHPQPRPPRLPALQRLRPTPMMTGTLSSMHMASPRLPVALRPPSPSRPTPLELVGAPATNAAAVCARPPSAPCGGRSDVLSPVLCALSAGVASSCGFVCFSVGAGLLFRWRREADFGGLLRFLPPVLCGARLSLRFGSVLWGMSTAPLVFDVLLGDATLAYTCGAPCLARDCPGGFCPLSRGSCPLAPLLCESSRASDLTLRASLAWAFVARFPRSRGVGLHV